MGTCVDASPLAFGITPPSAARVPIARTRSWSKPSSSPAAEGFSEIFERTGPYVWRTLRRLGVRGADLPDKCQDVFIVVHRRLADFDGGKGSLGTWIYGICLRVASAYRRRAPQTREVPEAEAHEHSLMAEQEEVVERKRAREWLDAALGDVSDEDRAIFVLYEVEELPMTEIAALLGCHLQTAYSRLHRARRHVESAFRARVKRLR